MPVSVVQEAGNSRRRTLSASTIMLAVTPTQKRPSKSCGSDKGTLDEGTCVQRAHLRVWVVGRVVVDGEDVEPELGARRDALAADDRVLDALPAAQKQCDHQTSSFEPEGSQQRLSVSAGACLFLSGA